MMAHQGSGGRISSGAVEVGYRHWFNQKVYGALSAGIFPFESERIEGDVGALTSASIGFNLDNVLRLEYGLIYYHWGESLPTTSSFTGKVIVPVKFLGINEIFGGLSFPGNSQGTTSVYVIHVGFGKLF